MDYIRSVMAVLCISAFGVCCAGPQGFRVLNLVVQPFGLFLFIIFYNVFKLVLKDFKVLYPEKENLTESLTC